MRKASWGRDLFILCSIVCGLFTQFDVAFAAAVSPEAAQTTPVAQESPTAPASTPQNPESKLTPQQRESLNILLTAIKAGTRGPAEIPLSNQGVLHLPEGYLFVPAIEAKKVMGMLGNKTGPDLLGLIFSRTGDIHWYIAVEYFKSGYVKDDDAKNLNADKLLSDIKEYTEEGNKDLVAKGRSPIHVMQWIQAPLYDHQTHQLVWSILAKSNRPDNLVNYNAYTLGREGMLSFVLVTPYSMIEPSKIDENTIMTSYQFNEGKRYSDFRAGTDRVAAFGLAALIAGLAAKKLGLVALLGVFLVKIWKGLVVVFLLFYTKIKVKIKKWFNIGTEYKGKENDRL